MSNERNYQVPTSQLDTLRWQFGFARQLADYHLPYLTDEMCLWEPAPGSWSVKQAPCGSWYPDWADEEPDPPPPVTIGWLTWHIIWWWSGLLDVTRGKPLPPREEIPWPGTAEATLRCLESLSNEWTEVLSELRDDDLQRPFAYPWSNPRPLSLTIAWSNSELMKNVAEIGIVRHLFEASRKGG